MLLMNYPQIDLDFVWNYFNKYSFKRIVGGSSGGEGCIVGAAGAVFGIGSDIGGSIRMVFN